MLMPLRRYADFRGRSDRTEFWTFALFVIVAWSILAVIDQALGFGRMTRTWDAFGGGMIGTADWNGGLLSLVFWLAMLIPGLAVATRRLHDTNKSAGWLLLMFVPVFGWIVLLIFYTQQSWPVANRWGTPVAEDARLR